MKSIFRMLGIVALAAIVGFAMTSCGDDGGEPAGPAEPPETAMYSGAAADGSRYTLKVIENTGRYAAQDGDDYILYQVKDGITKTSSGTVTMLGNLLTLKPANITITFTIKIDETGIIEIKGTITFDDRTEIPAPGVTDPLPELPENWPEAERWFGYAHNDPPITATLNFAVDKEGVCAITVGGKAVPPLNENGGSDGNVKYWNSIWRVTVGYSYTIIAGKTYAYTFEAWTDGPERVLNVQWYNDNDFGVYQQTGWDDEGDWETSACPPVFKITSERKTYTLTSDGPLPRSKPQGVDFQCANQTGTFYVKMLSIDSF